jgi:hypothetical protein
VISTLRKAVKSAGIIECANCSMRVPPQTGTANRTGKFLRKKSWLCGICQQDFRDFRAEAARNRQGLATVLLFVAAILVMAIVMLQLLLTRGLNWVTVLPLALPVLPYVLRNDFDAFLRMNEVLSPSVKQTKTLRVRHLD